MSLLLLCKRIVSRLCLIDNYCKRCGRRTEAFTVSDELYERVVPDGGERCFRCFDRGVRGSGYYPVWRVVME